MNFPLTPVRRPDLLAVRAIDSGCLPMTAHMERVGTAIDIPYLRSLSEELSDKISDSERRIQALVPKRKLAERLGLSASEDDEEDDGKDDLINWDDIRINPNSAEQLAWLLFDALGLGGGMKLKSTGGGQRLSTGKKQLEALKDHHEIVPLILDYRELVKLKTTYVDKLPRIAVYHPAGSRCPVCGLSHPAASYRIHTKFGTTRAETSRFNSRDPNLQNIPARTELGRRVRLAFIPTAGWVLVSGDESQIELRILADNAQDEYMLDVYRNDRGDIHTLTAAKVFNVPVDRVDKLLHRLPCKNVNFGIVYGLTERGLYAQLILTLQVARGEILKARKAGWEAKIAEIDAMLRMVTLEWCGQFIRDWFKVFASVEPYMKSQHAFAEKYGYVFEMWGGVRFTPELRSVYGNIREAGKRQAGNHPIQGGAAGVLKIAMNYVWKRVVVPLMEAGVGINPLLTIHDELMFEVEPWMAEEFGEMLSKGMTECCELRVPLKSDVEVMDRWRKE